MSSANPVPKKRMFSVPAIYVLEPLQLRQILTHARLTAVAIVRPWMRVGNAAGSRNVGFNDMAHTLHLTGERQEIVRSAKGRSSVAPYVTAEVMVEEGGRRRQPRRLSL